MTSTHAGSTTAAPGNDLHAWGLAHLATLMGLSNQATQLGRSAGTAQQLVSGCSQLGSTVEATLHIPPPPDSSAATHLHKGLTQLQQFARDCSAAFSGNAGAGSRMLAEETQGTAEINLAIQAVQRS